MIYARKTERMWLRMIALTLICFFCLSVSVYADRSVTINQVDVHGVVQSDGSVEMTERYEISFDGRFEGMFRYIYLRHGMELSNFHVEENGQAFEFNPGTDYGPTGTYLVERRGDRVLVDLSIDAANTNRTYTYYYRIENAIWAHEDVAEFYYQFFGSENAFQMERVTVNLTLPPGASRNDIKAWAHGPLHGEVDIISDQQIRLVFNPLPAGEMLEGRITFPLELVPNATVRTGRTALPGILEEEQRWADEANVRRRSARMDLFLAPVVFLLLAGGAVFQRFRYKRGNKPEFMGDYYRELPAEYSPAVMSYLWKKEKEDTAVIMGTLMDLARRGYIRFQEFIPEKRGIFKRGRDKDYYVISAGKLLDDVTDYERMLLEVFFREVGGSSELSPDAWFTMGQIEAYTKKKSQARTFGAYVRDFYRRVKREADQYAFFEKASVGRFFLQVGLGVALILSSAKLQEATDWNFISIAMGLGGIVVILTSLNMRRFSKRGAEDYAKWKAFRKFLTDFSAMPMHEIPSLIIWEHYLVYAIPLGVAEQVIKQLQIVFPNMEQDGYRFGAGWYVGYQGMNNFSEMNTFFEDASKAIQTSYREATSRQSSGSGGGGGASGGGGGGGGGGGVGFR